jgi:hypothetical protein
MAANFLMHQSLYHRNEEEIACSGIDSLSSDALSGLDKPWKDFGPIGEAHVNNSVGGEQLL